LSAPTSTKNVGVKKAKGEHAGVFEKLGNLQLPWARDSNESAAEPSPKASWDHTPANSEEARDIELKRGAVELKKQAKAEFNAQVMAALKSVVPSWLMGSNDDPGAINCLLLKEYRSGTWICMTLATFNTLSGITTLLIYLDYIFEDGGKL